MTHAATATGGDELIRALHEAGIDTVFGVPGIQLDGALDALVRSDAPIRFFALRHEQAASYMADGYARATGSVGACFVVPGPGLLNATAGIATGYACSSPILVISGDIDSGFFGQGIGMLHEIPDQSAVLRALTKNSARVVDPGSVATTVRAAVSEALSGRPRPVGLEFPVDVLHAHVETRRDSSLQPGVTPETDPESLRGLASLVTAARHPLIYAGGGVHASGAHDELTALAEELGAPVVTSLTGPGAIPGDNPWALTRASLADAAEHADLMLVVGSRFMRRDGTPELFEREGVRFAYLNAEVADTREPRPQGLAVIGDARATLAALRSQLDGSPAASAWQTEQVAELRDRLDARTASLAPQKAWLSAIRRAMPRESYFVSEMTQMGYAAQDFYPVYHPRGFITAGYQGTLGYGFATALGVKVGAGDTPVVSINGDGGFGWTLQELATAAKYRIALITIVFRDDAFGNVKRIQRDAYEGRHIGVDLHNPDLVSLAASFGVAGMRAESPQELERAILAALELNAPVLIDVPVPELPDPWSLLG